MHHVLYSWFGHDVVPEIIGNSPGRMLNREAELWYARLKMGHRAKIW
jgi:hypothetical protein